MKEQQEMIQTLMNVINSSFVTVKTKLEAEKKINHIIKSIK
jgi:hypothetical protein